jgi:hypothetical protein
MSYEWSGFWGTYLFVEDGEVDVLDSFKVRVWIFGVDCCSRETQRFHVHAEFLI